jgi:hypothetical protein
MKRPGDTTPDPPGGRAAERLRLFEGARRPPSEHDSECLIDAPPKGSRSTKAAKATKRSTAHAKQVRRKK